MNSVALKMVFKLVIYGSLKIIKGNVYQVIRFFIYLH